VRGVSDTDDMNASVPPADHGSRGAPAIGASPHRIDDALVMVAHELRNPLATLRYSLSLLRGLAASALSARIYAVMERQIELMGKLVNDLLDVTRIDQGTLDLQREEIRLAAVVSNAVDITESLIRQSAHALSVRVQSRKILVNADPLRLTQVFANLIDNACKYTPRGGRIVIDVFQQDGNAVVSIADNGVGIEPRMLRHVFDIYSRLPGRPKGPQGLGLGLALVKRLVELHGGMVQARSDGAETGSTFVVTLPTTSTAPGRVADQAELEFDSSDHTKA
jgi:signal transduction histidine kinase